MSQDIEKFINEMRMDGYWDVFANVEAASKFVSAGAGERI
jgi:hypothetical protein